MLTVVKKKERVGKVTDKIKGIACAVPFAMKAGDEILTSSSKDVDGGTSIEQHVEQKSVWQDLLKGELTQEVEELRYETFRAEEESNNYQYIGNGVALKKKGDSNLKRKKFVQYNYDEEYSVHETLEMLNQDDDRKKDDWVTRKIFKARYSNPNTRFKLENHVYKVAVNLGEDRYSTKFYFVDDSFNRSSRPLVNLLKKTRDEIKKIEETGNDRMLSAYKERNEICSGLDEFWFKTINATNDVPNGIDYKFRGARFEGICEEDGYVVLEYSWKHFDGNILLSERFKSKTGEQKFANKEKREGYNPGFDSFVNQDPTEARDRDYDNLEEWLEGFGEE